MITLYELVGAEGRSFSPNVWRTRMALAHKNLPYETVPLRFSDIATILDGKQKTVPVISDSGRIVADSWAIANYLEDSYPRLPSLFGGGAGRALTLFVQSWTADSLHRGVIDLVLLDIYSQLHEADKAYFRSSREKRFGRSLEDVQAGREARVAAFRASLQPLRTALAAQPWLGGQTSLYADYLVFGAFQWARMASRFVLIADDDPIAQWFGRCLDLFDGLGRHALPDR
ncbi:MAG TPA: glutathione S-transferase family protein [Micropepsaceae bacterium]|nr:glutathione S-transferase family protein [Micropepsaceae bacterium]